MDLYRITHIAAAVLIFSASLFFQPPASTGRAQDGAGCAEESYLDTLRGEDFARYSTVELTVFLRDYKDPVVRSKAAAELGARRSVVAAGLLAGALDDEDDKVRKNAARALVEIGLEDTGRFLEEAYDWEDLAAVAGAYRYFMEKGGEGSATMLVKALDEYGDREMAEDFAASGSPELEKAGRGWLEAHGFSSIAPAGHEGPRRGGSR